MVLPLPVQAQYYEEYVEEAERPAVGFVEATGGWGVQLGETDFLPDGAPAEWKHPFVSGWTVGGSLGWLFARDLALVGSYEYRTASSREGTIDGALNSVQGEIDYHTVGVGLRLYRSVGAGRVRAEFGVMLGFPYETQLDYVYAPGLAAAGISGEGRRTDEYGYGYGVRAQLGWEIPVGGPVYVAFGVGVRAFQADNDDEQTRLDNVVTDFAATPPVATTTTIDYGDGDARPTTNSAQDVDGRISLGVRF